MISMIAGLLVSCSSGLDEETTISLKKEKVNLTFTLVADTPGARSRATFGDNESSMDAIDGNKYENLIDGNGLQVLLYSLDNKYLGEVENVVVVSTENENIYQFIGNLSIDKNLIKDGTLACKVMTLANCPQVNMPTGLDELQYTYSSSQNIPMWGVATYKNLSIVPGTRTDLGTIYLLRAMAKVEVRLDESLASSYNLTEVSINEHNETGYCLPTAYRDVESTKELDTETVFRSTYDAWTDNALIFNRAEDGSYVIYLPEYDVSNQSTKIKVSLKKGEESVVLTDPTINLRSHIGNYIIRNHYYRFVIKKIGKDKIDLKLFYQVGDWDSKEIDIPSFE